MALLPPNKYNQPDPSLGNEPSSDVEAACTYWADNEIVAINSCTRAGLTLEGWDLSIRRPRMLMLEFNSLSATIRASP
jgi:hypothetical protein